MDDILEFNALLTGIQLKERNDPVHKLYEYNVISKREFLDYCSYLYIHSLIKEKQSFLEITGDLDKLTFDLHNHLYQSEAQTLSMKAAYEKIKEYVCVTPTVSFKKDV